MDDAEGTKINSWDSKNLMKYTKSDAWRSSFLNTSGNSLMRKAKVTTIDCYRKGYLHRNWVKWTLCWLTQIEVITSHDQCIDGFENLSWWPQKGTQNIYDNEISARFPAIQLWTHCSSSASLDRRSVPRFSVKGIWGKFIPCPRERLAKHNRRRLSLDVSSTTKTSQCGKIAFICIMRLF